MIIDKTYFVGAINIPNSDKPEIAELLDITIAQHEPDLLRQILGIPLYNAFKTALALEVPAPVAPAVSPAQVLLEQRFIDLRNGKEYAYGNLTKRWNGLIQSEALSGSLTLKKSLIANWVYYWYMRNKVSETTGTGEARNKKENATSVSPARKMADAFNEMCKEIQSLFSFLNDNTDAYPEWNAGRSQITERDWRPVMNTLGI